MLLFGVAAPPAFADAESVRKSVVHLHTEFSARVSINYQDGTSNTTTVTSAGSCTGFFASEAGDISTAGHCVDDADAARDIKVAFIRQLVSEGAVIKDDATFDLYYKAIELLSDPSRRVLAYQPQGMSGAVLTSAVEVQVVDFKPLDEGDHALLRLNGFEKPTPAVSFAASDPGSGTDVAAMGFPGVVADLTDAYRKPASVFYGKVSGFAPRKGVPFTEIGIVMSRGMSGGPVFDASTDAVYGNVSFGPSADSGETNDINFATDTTDMTAFLKSHGVPIDISGTTAEKPAAQNPAPENPAAENPVRSTQPKVSTAGIAIAAISVVLVLAGGVTGVIVLLVRRGHGAQRAKAMKPPGGPAQAAWSPAGPQPGQPGPANGQHQQDVGSPARPPAHWPQPAGQQRDGWGRHSGPAGPADASGIGARQQWPGQQWQQPPTDQVPREH